MKILVINAGSSSLKYQLFNMDSKEVLCSGYVERIGQKESFNTHKQGDNKRVINVYMPSHSDAMREVVKVLTEGPDAVLKSLDEVDGVGHRVVHGGTATASAIVTSEVVKQIRDAIPLAPLHNPANLTGIDAAQSVFKKAKNVAVFDTAFHQTLPDYAATYAIPYELAQKYKIRRYGFHGTSHQFVSNAVAERLGKPVEQCNIIICHLGQGASLCAVRNGKSVDTTMGMTPLEGVVMGMRSGSVDPAIVTFLQREAGMTPDQVDKMLTKESGLLGIFGKSFDARDARAAQEAGDPRADLAMNVMYYSYKKALGAYLAALDRVDAIAFCAGQGERAPEMREYVLKGLEHLGITFDAKENLKSAGGNPQDIEITGPGSKIRIFVQQTNEELEIARQTLALIGK